MLNIVNEFSLDEISRIIIVGSYGLDASLKKRFLEDFEKQEQCQKYIGYMNELFDVRNNRDVIPIPTEEKDQWIGGITALGKNLPKNCFLDKVKPGCGATTLAIENDEHYIIVAPFNPLLKNKYKKHKNTLVCYSSEFDKNKAINKIRKQDIVKVMVTYNSFTELMEWLYSSRRDVFDELNILVDEAHNLITEYQYRDNAIDQLHKTLLYFKDKLKITFMSATLPDNKYLISGFEDYPIQRIEWKKVDPVQVNVIIPVIRKKGAKGSVRLVNEIKPFIRQLIANRLEGKTNRNLYFLCNSVDYAIGIAKEMKLRPDQVKFCFANNTKNQEKLDKLSSRKRFEIVDIDETDENGNYYPVNFVTEASFEGCDCMDENAVAYIVTDVLKRNTLLDVATKYVQAIFRFRESKYKMEAYHLINATYDNEKIDEDEFKQNLKWEILKAVKLCERYNQKSDLEKGELITQFNYKLLRKDEYSRFMTVKTEGQYDDFGIENVSDKYFVVNEKMIQYAYFVWNIHNKVFSVDGTKNGINESYNRSLVVNALEPVIIDIDDDGIYREKLSYKGTIELFLEAVKKPERDRTDAEREFLQEVYLENREIMDFYTLRGEEAFKKVRYSKIAIQRALRDCPFDKKPRIISALKSRYHIGDYYENKVMKEFLQAIYEEIKYDRKAKATDIKEFCEVKRTTKDGKEVFRILNFK